MPRSGQARRTFPRRFARFGGPGVLLAAACSGTGGDTGTAASAWERSASNPLLTPAIAPAPATTYEVSIADPCVLYDETTGTFQAWYSATIFDTAISNDPGRIVIKYASSSDGLAWTAQSAPVLSSRGSSNDWDYTHVETPHVVLNPDPAAPSSQRYLLFYSGGNRDLDTTLGRPANGGFPYYAIGLAYSPDGTAFTRAPGLGGQAGLVLRAPDVLVPAVTNYGDGLIADPCAIVRDGHIELWCSSFAESIAVGGARSPLAFGISLAQSTNGLSWTTPTGNPLASLYKPGDVAGGEQPAVVYDAARHRYEMWFKNDTAAERSQLPTTFFTAHGFWRALSTDGKHWTVDYTARDFGWRPELDYEQYGLLTGCSVVRRGNSDLLYYSAWGTRGIPDPARYQVPLQAGGTAPAVITFAVAARPVR